MEKMQVQKTVWDELCKAADGSPWWKKVRDRSHMGLMVQQQIYGVCEAADWTITDEVQSIISGMFSGITQTKLIEDAMRDERMTEISKNSGRKVFHF